MGGGRSDRRRWWAAPLAVVLAVVATGCETEIKGGEEDRKPVTLVVSETWVANHQDGEGTVAARISALGDAIDDLRTETGTGWTGRQDDVTGYLAELTGGSWPGTPTDFMDTHGVGLFGVDSTTLRLDEPDTETVPGITTTRATQALGAVPVLDATLVFSGRGSSAATDTLRVTGIRGRVFPGLTVATTPTLTAEQAAAAAVELAGGSAEGDPSLVVVPTGAGVLAWEVVVIVGPGGTTATGSYFIDAHTGDLVQVRPVSAEIATPVPGAASLAPPTSTRPPSRARVGGAAEANSVEVTGADALGRQLTAYGLQVDAGVELTDTTTPAWDPATRTGAISTYDVSGSPDDESLLPGRLWVSPDTTITDPEVMAAQTYSHDIVEYFEGLGRSSWDDEGGSLVSSVHYGPSGFCNAFFAGYLSPPQMVYGNPCTTSAGQVSNSVVEPDIAAHEVTHGVTETSAGLIYAGQSGALNESFSDYFGNVIGNLVRGDDSVAVSEDSCSGMPGPNSWCTANPDGTLSLRYMLSGNDFDDYLRLLNPGRRLIFLKVSKQDFGGVHYNSAIWNNALWSIRTQLAKIDGQPGNTSELARAFDRAVYGALATRLTPISGFLDARAAVEQVVIDSGLDPVVLRVAREVFDQNKICAGCPTTIELGGDPVATTPQGQLHPSVSGDRVVWLDLSAGTDFNGQAGSVRLGSGAAPSLSGSPDAIEVGFAGDAIVALDLAGRVVRTDESGGTSLLDSGLDPVRTLAAGFAGSDAGAAWLGARDTVRFADAEGNVTFTDVSDLRGDAIDVIGTGGGSVAIGTDQGKILRWTPGDGGFTQVGKMSGAVLSIATYGGSVFAVDVNHRSVLVTADGRTLNVSSMAWPFGATMSDEYVVWTEATGAIKAGVAPGGVSQYPETDLYLLSLETGKVFSLHTSPAQQGFPSLSGRRLVWQDATYGGDDVVTTVLPGGL